MLAPLVRRGLVTLIPWPAMQGLQTPQGQQLNHCFKDAGHQTVWMANADVDEFIVVLGQKASRQLFKLNRTKTNKRTNNC